MSTYPVTARPIVMLIKVAILVDLDL